MKSAVMTLLLYGSGAARSHCCGTGRIFRRSQTACCCARVARCPSCAERQAGRVALPAPSSCTNTVWLPDLLECVEASVDPRGHALVDLLRVAEEDPHRPVGLGHDCVELLGVQQVCEGGTHTRVVGHVWGPFVEDRVGYCATATRRSRRCGCRWPDLKSDGGVTGRRYGRELRVSRRGG